MTIVESRSSQTVLVPDFEEMGKIPLTSEEFSADRASFTQDGRMNNFRDGSHRRVPERINC
jgi:hypothetical protein